MAEEPILITLVVPVSQAGHILLGRVLPTLLALLEVQQHHQGVVLMYQLPVVEVDGTLILLLALAVNLQTVAQHQLHPLLAGDHLLVPAPQATIG